MIRWRSYARLCAGAVLAFVACAPGPVVIDHPPYDFDTQRVYESEFGVTWDALMRVLTTFPLDTVERHKGLIVTDWIDGTAALHLKRRRVQELEKKPDRGFGIITAELAPGLPYVAWVVPGSAADQAGVRPREIIRSINGINTNDIDDLGAAMRESDTATLTLIGDNGLARDVTLTAKRLEIDYTYQAFASRYRLVFRLERVDGGRTRVRIDNEEEADFESGEPQSRYAKVRSSTVKEWILLDELEAELDGF